MAANPARRGPRRIAGGAAERAGGLRRGDRRSGPDRPARAVALAASAFLRLFPRQCPARRHSRRSRQHRARRDRALLAVEPGGDGNRRGRRPIGCGRCSGSRRPGAGSFRTRRRPARWWRSFARASGRPVMRWRAADFRAKRASRASTCRRTRTARSTRARFLPASAATTCASFRSTPNSPCAPMRLAEMVAEDLANGDLPCAIVASVGHDGDHGDRSDRRASPRSPGDTASGCTSTRRWRAAR